MAPVWLIPALTYLCVVQGQSHCLTPDSKTGDCVSMTECPLIMGIANKAIKTPEERTFMKNSICEFEGTNPKVCCPLPKIQNPCFTPEGYQGQCINVYRCEHIASRLLAPTATAEDRAYVNSTRCQSQKPGLNLNVCCGPAPGQPPPPQPEPAPVGTCMSSAPPERECCGSDGDNDDRIMGGNATGIDQYPWLALIEYRKRDENNIRLLCGGVLISGRYVLTAGHCLKGPVLNIATPTSVRLGEYDTSNYGRDCVPIAGGDPGDRDCTNEPISIPIERIMHHPHYDPNMRSHDIAMLKLSQHAPYTDFIRPICLPTRDVTRDMQPNAMLVAAGWGATQATGGGMSRVKQHVRLPYQTIQTCQAAYNEPGRRIPIYRGQICAGGERGRDACRGDSGGPLMYSDGGKMEVVGIVSFGPVPCGQENVPGVYTKVYEYMDWITRNMRP